MYYIIINMNNISTIIIVIGSYVEVLMSIFIAVSKIKHTLSHKSNLLSAFDIDSINYECRFVIKIFQKMFIF